MSSVCAVLHCKSKRSTSTNEEKMVLYSFPPIVRGSKNIKTALKTKRCKAWLNAINRKDLKDTRNDFMQRRIKRAGICGQHFVSGTFALL